MSLNPNGELCGRCGEVAKGYAFIGDTRYCHEDPQPTCYMLASWDQTAARLHGITAAEAAENVRDNLPRFIEAMQAHNAR